MADETNSALSGGLLVIIGILVALGAVYFFLGDKVGLRDTSDKPNISINMPAAPSAPAAPAAQ